MEFSSQESVIKLRTEFVVWLFSLGWKYPEFYEKDEGMTSEQCSKLL